MRGSALANLNSDAEVSMILVIGATGFLGSEICRRLAGSGQQVRALVRTTSDRARLDALRSAGVELATGDLKDRASLDAACVGVSTVISTASAAVSRQAGDSIDAVDGEGQLRLAETARAAGVEHFIYISFSGQIELDSPLRTAKRTMEDVLRRSGMAYTIFRPSYFMEVWLSPALGFDVGKGVVQVYGNGERRVSFMSLVDVAQFAVACVGNPRARNRTIELGGPEALSQLDVIRTFGELRGRPLETNVVPEEGLRAQHEAAADPMQKTFAALMLGYARGDAIDMKETLAEFPIRLTTVRDYALRTIGRSVVADAPAMREERGAAPA